MSLFPRSIYGSDPSFTPLFRLLDDFDSYTREVQGAGNNQDGRHRRHQAVRSFNPKFDVRETENNYELHGELPGIEKDNVTIEFTEPQTIVIRGRIERSYTSGAAPAGLVEGEDAQVSGAVESGEQHRQSHRASVEDEESEMAKEEGNVVAKSHENGSVERPKAPLEKFWVSERSIGEFSRTFSFPSRIEQEGVAASLNSGLLTVVVPKAKKHETRRVAIN